MKILRKASFVEKEYVFESPEVGGHVQRADESNPNKQILSLLIEGEAVCEQEFTVDDADMCRFNSKIPSLQELLSFWVAE